MAWHYVQAGQTQGPVDLTELQRLRQQGVVEADTPVWTDGMTDWAPYQQSSAASGPGSLMTAGTAVARRPCVECGKTFPEDEMLEYEGKWVCAACKPIFFQRIKEGVVVPGVFNYASIGKRFVAVFIDGILIDIVIFTPILLMYGFQGLSPQGRSGIPFVTNTAVTLFEYLVPALYEIILVGRFGATLGKMAMGIKVVTAEGGRVSYARATGRHFAKILSSIILGIGYLMAFWDPERRTLHDRICNTRVISVES